MYLTYGEIKDQYNALGKTIGYLDRRRREIVDFFHDRNPASLTYIGSGSSYLICRSLELAADLRLNLPARALPAGDLLLNHAGYGPWLRNGMIVAPSRSGNTSEVLRSIQKVRAHHPLLPTAGIACSDNSELGRLADLSLVLSWADDQSVCQTRAVVNLYAACLMMVAYWCNEGELIENLAAAAEHGNAFMEAHEGELERVARGDWKEAVILADGEMRGLAGEGALAFTEIARIPGRFHHLLDVRHGPLVTVNRDSLVIACLGGEGLEYQIDLIADLRRKGATVVVYSDMPTAPIEGTSLQIASGLELVPAVRGIPFIYISQALAYFKAIEKGIDPDRPEGLEAWIELPPSD